MIEVYDVKKSYGRNEILKGVSLCANPGDMVAIIGRNGCGKSTFLKILAGIDNGNRDSKILFFGKDASKNRKLFRKYVGYLPQENPLFEDLSVADNISLWSGDLFWKKNDILDYLEIDKIKNKKVQTLSGGMKRRVAIGCALSNMPPILIMDEPTAALDIYYKKDILEFMKRFCAGNGTIIFATHDDSEIAASSKVLLMEDGMLKER